MVEPTQVQILRDLVYHQPELKVNPYHTLDLYLPPATSTPPPVLVFVHGGFWNTGDKAEHHQLTASLCHQAKVAVASVNYRQTAPNQTPMLRFPCHLEDVAHAVGFVWAYGEQFGYNSQRMYLSGHSVGASMVALLGLCPKRYLAPVFQDHYPDADWSHLYQCLQGVIGIDGIYDFPLLISTFPHYRSRMDLIFGNHPERWPDASPRLGEVLPDVLTDKHLGRLEWCIVHSLEDELVDLPQSQDFIQYLHNLQYRVVDACHLSGSHDGVLGTSALVETMTDFLHHSSSAKAP
ncbi:hypothetical protein IWQ62_004015 [Dispira parvispora]|uniref:BD-FAE-like domain-containing protein n=1 Tax=Dispira parvispora TaxID=1520584 RepID=A0A9W8AT73_9FUNG|nr:hypothetical protein IWQ62_004015 [Dispira parvispora]